MVPSVRARHMKAFMEAIDALKPPDAGSVRALANPDALLEIETCLPSAWLPIEMDVELTEHVSNVLGAARADRFYQKLTLGDYETSVFKSFIDMTVRMIGLSPNTYVKMVPHGFGLMYRDYGSFRALEREENRARLLFSTIPAVCCKNPLWLESVRSSFHTAFDLTNTRGLVEWDDLDLAGRRAVFSFRWTASMLHELARRGTR
jgi:hypothetical protein